MAQTASTQQNSKWKTSDKGYVYTLWDSNVIVKDTAGKMVQLNQHLKKEHDVEEKIGEVWYKARDMNGTFLIYAENDQKHQERQQQRQSSGSGGSNWKNKSNEDWYRIVDVYTTEDVTQLVYKITQEKFSPWGKTFVESTQVVNGKLVYGLVRREKVQPGGSSSAADAGPQEAQPPV